MTSPTRPAPEPAGARLVSCAVIINQGSGTVSEIWDKAFEQSLLETLRRNGWEPELRLVSGEEIASEVERALKAGVGAIIAGGGDGTATSIAARMREADVPLGILPFGTLNLAARDLGVPLDPLAAVESLRPGRVRSIDILDVNDRACLCMTILGVYPELLERMETYHGRNWGIKFARLCRQVFNAYFKAPVFTIQLTADDRETRSVRTRFLLLTPGEYEDDWGILPRRSRLSTGRCHAYVSKHLSRWSVLRMALRFMVGRFRADPDLQVIEAAKIVVSVPSKRTVKATVDGELMTFDLPIEFDLQKRSLKVLEPFAPDKDAAKS